MALIQLNQLTKAEKHLNIAYDTALRTNSTMTVHTLEAILELKRKKWEVSYREIPSVSILDINHKVLEKRKN
jgi:hypothetical protein